jgi:hypothetical protein
LPFWFLPAVVKVVLPTSVVNAARHYRDRH